MNIVPVVEFSMVTFYSHAFIKKIETNVVTCFFPTTRNDGSPYYSIKMSTKTII